MMSQTEIDEIEVDVLELEPRELEASMPDLVLLNEYGVLALLVYAALRMVDQDDLSKITIEKKSGEQVVIKIK